MNRMIRFIATSTVSLISAGAIAKSEMNAMCYLEDKAGSKVEGTNLQNMYEIASVSKMVTSFWVINKLGPDFRFTNYIYLEPLGRDEYNVHIRGSADPYFGREMTHFLFSELSRFGVQRIRTLSFDEGFSLFWSVREKPTWSIAPSTRDIANELIQKVKINSSEYTATRLLAQKLGLKLQPKISIRVDKVQFISKNEYNPTVTAKIFELKSAPLHSYLKEMNRNSNNHVADHLFELMGGAVDFQQFMKKRLNLDPMDIRLVNGSGDRFFVQDNKDHSFKAYNEASCAALVQVVSAMRTDLRKSNYDIQHIMAVSGLDPNTTLGGRYSSAQMSGAVVAKTGSVDPAITLAGMITTEQGNVYFGILYKTKSPSDWNSARNLIRNDVAGLMNKFGGKNAIGDYSSITFLPFDAGSQFKEMSQGRP